MSEIVYLSLGSNLGDRFAWLDRALASLAALGEVVAVSSYYETEPVEVTEQPWFVNAAASVRSRLDPFQFLENILKIERSMGRQRTRFKGPRTIDLDILFFGERIISAGALTVPHPGIATRRFVLEPLCEIAPGLRHPVLHATMAELRDRLPAGQAVRRLPSRFPAKPA